MLPGGKVLTMRIIITSEALAGDGGLYMGCDILALTINKYDIRTKTVLVVIVSK